MRSSLALAVLLGGALAAPPAQATQVDLGLTGSVSVYPDMGACGSLSTPYRTTIVGQFSAAGAIQGPGTLVGAVRGALPVAVTNGTGWFGCLPDAYAGATTGYATYTLSASTPATDFVATVHCTIVGGSMRCV